MRRPRILLLDFLEHDLEPEDWEELAALGEPVRCASGSTDLARLLGDTEVLLVQLGVAVTRAMLEAAPRLRYVGVFGTSIGRIDAEVTRRGVEVHHVPGFSTESVAELTIALVLDHLRGIGQARERGARGDLSEPRRLGAELRGRRLGVVGLGAIGRRVAEIAARGFGAEVVHWTRTPRPDAPVPRVSLEALLAGSEIVCVHLALCDETRGILDAPRLAHLPEGALLVHLSPLELLDLDALRPRLRGGRLSLVTDHGDELAAEALAALRAEPGCTLFPPIGYATREASSARRARFLADLRAFVAR